MSSKSSSKDTKGPTTRQWRLDPLMLCVFVLSGMPSSEVEADGLGRPGVLVLQDAHLLLIPGFSTTGIMSKKVREWYRCAGGPSARTLNLCAVKCS